MLGPHVTTKYVDTICDLLNIYIYVYIYVCMYTYMECLESKVVDCSWIWFEHWAAPNAPDTMGEKWLAILYLNLVGETMCQTGI